MRFVSQSPWGKHAPWAALTERRLAAPAGASQAALVVRNLLVLAVVRGWCELFQNHFALLKYTTLVMCFWLELGAAFNPLHVIP